MKKITLLFLYILGLSFAYAQPANDACPNATLINNVNNFCSAAAAGTTVNATDDAATTGGFGAATCWGGTVTDVWYKFVAIATDVTIIINGNQGSPVGGTLLRPQVALYSGTCSGTLNELTCGTPPAGQHIIQIYKGGLTIGETYLIRVDGINANKGTFQYCINNYNPVPSPKSDCPTAVVLCDKSNFSVPAVSGAGTNSSEMNAAACFGYDGFSNVETNSAWYAFTFSTAGTFTFSINPSNPNDDIDFVVYRLPNGIGNCNGKSLQRCEASQCPPNWTTGLNTTATDISEDGGCLSGQDNFLKQLTVAAGETYALGINNFTSTGNGFSIAFGGTAQIQGPTPIINDNDANDIICVNEPISYSDASTPPPSGILTEWIWNFGSGATPATFSGQNPPSVIYATNGIKTVSLTVKSDRGCQVTSTKTITVTTQPPTVTINASQNNICPNTSVTFTATSTNGGTSPIYQWYKNNILLTGETNPTYTTSTLANNDQIKATVVSNSTCALPNTATSNIITMIVTTPQPVNVNISGNLPVCPSSSLTLTANPTNGGAAPTYQWFLNGNPVGTNSNIYSSSSFNNNDVVTVRLTSSLTCITGNPQTSNPITITIKPNPIVTVTNPSICDGQKAQPIASGASSYTWTGGLASVSNPTTPNLTTTTTYTVTGTTNGCVGTAISTVTVKPNPTVTVTSPSICSGFTAQPIASGASSYTWTNGLAPVSNPTTPNLTTTTTYTVTGTTNGCIGTAVSTVTVKPNPIVTVTNPSICSGFTAQPIASGASSYTWTNGLAPVSNPTTPNLITTTTYTVTGTTNGCIGTAVSTVTVKPNPIVTVTNPSICDGQKAQPIASGASSYTWTGGLASVSNPTTPNLTTTTTYTVTGTTNGCIGTATSTVTVKPNPTVTVTSPSICSGFTAQPIASGASSYTWTNGLSPVSNPTTPNLTTTTSYTVTGTAANGCKNTAVSTVTVKQNPVVTVTNPSICSGFTAQPIASGASSYTWTNGLAPVSSPTTPNLTTTTTYTVTGTTNGCIGTAVSTVTVKPNPIVTVTNPSICDGQKAQPIASGASSYTWTNGLAPVSNPTTPNLTTTTTYTVTGTTNGCIGTATSTVTVKPNPTITVTSPSICSGFTAQPIASGASSYTWTNGLASVSNPITPNLTTTTSYTVTGTAANGCKNTAVSTVTVKPNPVVTVTNPSICSGFTAQPIANGASSYTWTNGLAPVSNPTTPNLTTTTTYTVTGTTNGCIGTAVSTVTVKPNPIVTVTNPSICDGQKAQPIASGASSYTWTGGLASVSNPTTPNLTTTTTYTVTGTTNGCVGTAVSTVTVKPNPIITVNNPSICSGFTATLNASGATTYAWSNGLGSGSSVVTPALTTNKNYVVIGTSNGCTGTATSSVIVKSNPNVTVNSPNICTGQSATLLASGATSYTWSNGLGNGDSIVTPVLSSDQTYSVVGTLNGCTDTALVTVIVRPSLLISVNNPIICSGFAASLSATGASSYTWTGGLASVANPTTPNLTTTTNYVVTGTFNGCSGTATATVTVKPNPVVTVANPSICEGFSTTLNANGATAYSWTGGLAAVSNPSTPNLSSTQTYTVTGTTDGCIGTATATVTVKPNPIVTVTNPSICDGQTAQPIASGATTYSWTGGLASVSNPVTPNLSTSTTYTVTGSTNGCIGTATSKVTVKPNPIVNVTSPSICDGFTATLNANGAASYVWSGGLASVSNPTTPNLNNNQTYTVIGTTNGCSDTATATVTIKPNPVVTVNNASICNGQNTTLLANGATTYTWTGGLAAMSNPTTPNLSTSTTYTVTGITNGCKGTATSLVTVKPTKTTNISRSICSNDNVVVGTQSFNQTGIYNVVLQTSENCDSTVILNLTVSPALTPTVSITASKTDICPNDLVTFKATATNTGLPPSYQWFVNGLPVGTNSASFSTNFLQNNDVVNVVVTTTAFCANPKIITSNSIKIIQNKVNYTLPNPKVQYCIGDSQIVDLQISSVPNQSYSIKWINGTSITSDTTSIYTVRNTSSTNIPFEITFGNNCKQKDVMPVKVNLLPVINATVDIQKAKYEQEVTLDVVSNSPLSYVWTPSNLLDNDTIQNPVSIIKATTVFTVFVKDIITNCINSDTVLVELINECTNDYIYVPTGFSPNRDGINDCFGIMSPPKLSDFSMVIFDRWGEKVFESFDKDICWDGTYKGLDALSDSYAYVITFKCYNGTPLSKKGTITIIR